MYLYGGATNWRKERLWNDRKTGRRLDDETPSFSPDQLNYYGRPIPVGIGLRRIKGTLLWSSNVDVFSRTDSNGDEITEEYVSFAYSFGYNATPPGNQPRVEFLRLWAGDVLIFDNIDLERTRIIAPYAKVKFYPGTEEQLPDEHIVQVEGRGRTPAFRGHAYAVFQRFDIKRYGRQIPEMWALISDIASDENPAWRFRTLDGAASALPEPPSGQCVITDFDPWTMFAYQADAANVPYIRMYAMGSDYRSEIRRFEVRAKEGHPFRTDVNPFDVNTFFDFYRQQHLLFTNMTGGNTRPIISIDTRSGRVQDVFGIASSNTSNTETRFTAVLASCVITPATKLVGRQPYLVCGGFSSTIGLLAIGPRGQLRYAYGAGEDTPETFRHLCKGHEFQVGLSDATEQVWATSFIAHGTKIGRLLLRPSNDINWWNSAELKVGRSIEFDWDYWDFGAGIIPQYVLAYTDPGTTADLEDDRYCLLVWTENTNESPSVWELHQFEDRPRNAASKVPNVLSYLAGPGPGGNWRVEVPFISRTVVDPGFKYSNLDMKTIGWRRGSTFIEVDLVSGIVTTYAPFSSGIDMDDDEEFTFSPDRAYAYNSLNRTMVTTAIGFKSGFGQMGAGKIFVHKPLRRFVELRDVLEWMLIWSGYDQSEIEIVNIPDVVMGVTITQRENLFDLLDRIGRVYRFDYYESEGKIKIVRRNQDSIVNSPDFPLDQEELAFLTGQVGPAFRIERDSERNMPNALEIKYLNFFADMNVDVIYAKRTKFPVSTSKSDTFESVDLPILTTPTDMRRQAVRALYRTFDGRTIGESRLPQRFLRLEPTDTIRLTVNGYTYYLQATQTSLNADFSVSFSFRALGIEEVAEVDTPAGGAAPTPQQIPAKSYSVGLPLDLPLLSPLDDMDGSQALTYSIVLSEIPDGWIRAALQWSYDRGQWSAAEQITQLPAFGYAVNVLPFPASGPFAVDDSSVLIVALMNGPEPEPLYDPEAIFDDGNFFLVGQPGRWELCQYGDAINNGDGSWTLSMLVRGRRGTDIHVGDHEEGDYVIFLRDLAAVGRRYDQIERLGEDLFARAIGAWTRELETVVEITTVAGNTYRPWAVANVRAELQYGQDVQLRWERRTRVADDGYPDDGPEDTPLDEASEEYELEILDGPGGSVVRTVLGLSAPEFLYTDAMQTADGFAAPIAQVSCRIYQISAVVGRGFAREETVDVE